MKKKSSERSKSAISNEPWEFRYSTNTPSHLMKQDQGADFAPKQSKDRSTVYVKVNECDY